VRIRLIVGLLVASLAIYFWLLTDRAVALLSSGSAAGIALGIGWVAVTTWAYVAWRRESGQPVQKPAAVGTAEQPTAR